MPVTLSDITQDTVTVDIRGVAVSVRGFDFTEVGLLLASYSGMQQALAGNIAAVLIDKPLMDHALATCVGELPPEMKLKPADRAALLKEIFRLTWEDAIGPFVDLAASIGGSAASLADEIIKAATSSKSSSPPSAGSGEPDTPETKSSE